MSVGENLSYEEGKRRARTFERTILAGCDVCEVNPDIAFWHNYRRSHETCRAKPTVAVVNAERECGPVIKDQADYAANVHVKKYDCHDLVITPEEIHSTAEPRLSRPRVCPEPPPAAKSDLCPEKPKSTLPFPCPRPFSTLAPVPPGQSPLPTPAECRALYADLTEENRVTAARAGRELGQASRVLIHSCPISAPRFASDPSQMGLWYESMGAIMRYGLIGGYGVMPRLSVSQSAHTLDPHNRRQPENFDHRHQADLLTKWVDENAKYTNLLRAWKNKEEATVHSGPCG